MSRAIRRQQSKQSAAPKESAAQAPRSLGVNRRPPTTSRGARAPISAKKRLLRQPAWMGDITSELRKVTWPTRDETVYLTTVVIVVALVVGTLLGGIDLFFNWLIDRLLLR